MPRLRAMTTTHALPGSRPASVCSARPSRRTTSWTPAWPANGLTAAGWVQTVNAITDIYISAWHNKPLMMQYAPFYVQRWERREFTDYAGSRGVGMKHNRLLVDHDDQVINNPTHLEYRAGQYDAMFSFPNTAGPLAWEIYRERAVDRVGRLLGLCSTGWTSTRPTSSPSGTC